MKRKCNYCDRPYQAQRPTSKFCSNNCRARNSQTGGPIRRDPVQPCSNKAGLAAGSMDAVADPSSPGDNNSLVKATRSELEAAGVVDTMLGQQALSIAIQMSGFETASGMAALSKELSRVMAEALRSAVSATADAVDELSARRDAKLAG